MEGQPRCLSNGWRQRPLWLLLAFAMVVHLCRLDAMTLRGEETRRAQVAVEMQRSGDWLVPREQGQLYFSRPPLQNWVIAACGRLTGGINKWAIRLPSALATVLTALLIYVYARHVLSPLGAMAAGVAYCTMGQVLELGYLGETEALFTLLVSGSLLLWHLGYTRRWPPLAIWTVAYALVALGTLCKGVQAPLYFAAAVGVFLLIRRDVRFALGWQHAAGIAVFLLIWGAWQLPYSLAAGQQASEAVYGRMVRGRFEDIRMTAIVSHLATYPFETLVGCLLPWSPLLWTYFRRGFWKSLGDARPTVLFLLVCLAVTFPSVWLPPGARSRYFMPLYPCAAVLVGLVIERCAVVAPGERWQQSWRIFAAVMAPVMITAGVVVAAASVADIPKVAQSLPFAASYLLASLVLAIVCYRTRHLTGGRAAHAAVLSVAAFAALTFNGVVVNVKVANSNDVRQSVAAAVAELPAEAELASLNTISHRFAFRYGKPVRRAAWPIEGSPDFEYFCFHRSRVGGELGFHWEKIAEVNLERERRDQPQEIVILGRVLPESTQVAYRSALPAER